MSLPLRRATGLAQTQWDEAVRQVAGAYARQTATMEASLAAAALRRMLNSETRTAALRGAQAVASILTAAGATPSAQAPGIQVGAPAQLERTIAEAWRASEGKPDAARRRHAAVSRIVDQALTAAWSDAIAEAIAREDTIVGWRRVSRPGCCGACLALSNGQVHPAEEPIERHPHCRCIQEPVVIDVNERSSGRPEPAARWSQMTPAEQDEMFHGHGGQAKADLLRDGHVTFDDLVVYAPRAAGARPVAREATWRELRELTLDRMDEAFAAQQEALTAAQRAAAREWQKTDRTYELVQASARGQLAPDGLEPLERDAIAAVRQQLSEAIHTAVTPRPLRVYRGVRSLLKVFGTRDPTDLIGWEDDVQGFNATTLLRPQAEADFTSEDGALLEIDLPASTPGLWVAAIGDPALRNQAELLLSDPLRVRVTGVRQQEGTPVLSLEVIP